MRWLAISVLALAAALGAGERPATAGARDSHASITLDALLTRFRAMPGLYAHYREEKHIALLAAPLVGEGTVHYAPPRRIARHAHTPAPSSVVFDGALLRFGDAHGEQRIDVGANPVVRAFIETFLDVLAGDRASLERTFVVSFHAGEDGERWDLSLVPRDASLASVLREVRLAGQGTVVSEMHILEATGDEGVTTFSDVDTAHRYSIGEAARIFRVSGNDGT
jgi:hypothetical protein